MQRDTIWPCAVAGRCPSVFFFALKQGASVGWMRGEGNVTAVVGSSGSFYSILFYIWIGELPIQNGDSSK
jgi:hypothetical protein